MITAKEKQFIERLRKHPHLMERFDSIIEIADAEGDNTDTADAVEERTVSEVRKLGNQVITDWAATKEATAQQALKKNHPKAQVTKKK